MQPKCYPHDSWNYRRVSHTWRIADMYGKYRRLTQLPYDCRWITYYLKLHKLPSFVVSISTILFLDLRNSACLSISKAQEFDHIFRKSAILLGPQIFYSVSLSVQWNFGSASHPVNDSFKKRRILCQSRASRQSWLQDGLKHRRT